MKDEIQLSRRERKKTIVKESLIESAYDSFSKNGYDQTRIEDITEKVDVSARTFFRYFSSKEDVVLEYQVIEYEEIISELSANNSDDKIFTALRKAAVKVTRGCEEGAYGIDPNRFRTLRDLIRNHPLIRAKSLDKLKEKKACLVDLISRKMDCNTSSDIRPLVIASAMEVSYDVAYDAWSGQTSSIPYSETLDSVMECIEYGLNFQCRQV